MLDYRVKLAIWQAYKRKDFTMDDIESGFTSNELKFVSTGLCPDCIECKDNYGYDSMDEFNQDYESGEICDEGSFSWNPCDDCNRSLGGDSYIAHGINDEDELIHFRICYNCFYEINGYTICDKCDHVCPDYGSWCANCDHENN